MSEATSGMSASARRSAVLRIPELGALGGGREGRRGKVVRRVRGVARAAKWRPGQGEAGGGGRRR